MTASLPPERRLDPVVLEIWWSRLAAFADEAATTLLRTAFSTIIRESNDYTVVIMNRAGETVAECRAGIPAFAALMTPLTQELLRRYPAEDWQEGDRVITNDPWIGIGHLPDLAMVAPVFHRGELVGFTGTAAHLPDVGGAPSMGRTELLAEGLLIPPMRLYRGGVLNEEVRSLLMANVRLQEQVWGDLQAQVAANETCRRRLLEFLDDIGADDLEELGGAIHKVTDTALRRSIAELPDGVYTSTVEADGVPGRPTTIECRVTIAGDRIEVDYAGTSPQVPFAINCTLPYTRAYTMNPLKLLLGAAPAATTGPTGL
ncbi:hydantoinase B/oxoprolinase family protein [Actinomadura madurae]|uniref:hydantoinase B/oxoprolinase family protein n=1 Tax=Actinomadura madurae TaxID=1993 RepID=UPI0020D21364|nr:hydantoinase B/oxoprolinase family protein [Actinomadura madurae]